MKVKQLNNIQNVLSSREKEIIQLIAYEYSTREIAKLLYLSFETIKSHRHSIMNKLGVNNVAGIVREAYYNSILNRHDIINLN
jgi:DNA-binding CsgD family transcriptional regulator